MKKILMFFVLIFVLLTACSPTFPTDISSIPSSTSRPSETGVPPSASMQVSQTQEVSPSPTPTQPEKQTLRPGDVDLADLITRKVQDYIQTKTFEGFTNTNTFQDVYESYSKKGMTPDEASVVYSVDLVGFPANMHCHFKPLLDRLTFDIVYEPGLKDYENKFNTFLSAIYNAFSSNFTKRDLGGNGIEYIWQNGTIMISIWTKADFYESTGQLAEIGFGAIDENGLNNNIPQNIPDIFHYQYGTDFNTINTHEMVSQTKEYTGYPAYLSYNLDHVTAEYSFSINPTLNAITFISGSYAFSDDTPLNRNDSIDLMDKTASNLQKLLGKPKTKEYEVSEDESVNTAVELKSLDYDEFTLSVDWDKTWLMMGYEKGQGISVELYLR